MAAWSGAFVHKCEVIIARTADSASSCRGAASQRARRRPGSRPGDDGVDRGQDLAAAPEAVGVQKLVTTGVTGVTTPVCSAGTETADE
jgi:hypothetical protein